MCTTPCSSADDCVAGWACAALLGQSGNVCQCSKSAEVCNGKDDDCNGEVDDPGPADADCVQTAGAGQVCQAGVCTCLSTCGGNCVDLTSDLDNCGACGQSCAHGTCANSSCTCPTNQTQCPQTGGCTDLASDRANCRTCGHACADESNATVACVSSACKYTCDPGYTDCNGQPGDGCEVHTDGDPHNCGACGHDCVGGACSGGVCQPVALTSFRSSATPVQLQVVTNTVYWCDQNGIHALSVDGGSSTLEWAPPPGLGFATGLAAVGTDLFWPTQRDSSYVCHVYRMSASGGAATAIVQTPNGWCDGQFNHIAGSDSLLAYEDDSSAQASQWTLAVIYTDGGPATCASFPSAPNSSGQAEFALGASNLYFTSFGGPIYSAPLTPSGSCASPSSVPGDVSRTSSPITGYGGDVFWGSQDGGIVKAAAGSPLSTVTVPGSDVSYLTADSQGLYWWEGESTCGSCGTPLREYRYDGGVVSQVALASKVQSIAVDSQAIYWIEDQGGSPVSTYVIKKVAK